ncbi:MAG TPA: restriction endonuclease [Candidatus Bathyarchaeia archaeon]|nr:restriction endonuclease [Candidatus Bathyarchaeia archaeon]
MLSYSWSRFGREAEFVVAFYLQSCGWDVQLSRGSRGPADLIATQGSDKWLIQVKSSSKIPRLKGHELKQLRKMAKTANGHPVIATVQHKDTVIVSSKGSRGVPMRGIARREEADVASYGIFFYSLDWEIMYPRLRNS